MTSPSPLPELPAGITRGQILQALEVLGLPPTDLLSVHLHVHGAEVDVFARNEHGERYVLGAAEWRPGEQDRQADRVATHRVCIPVVAAAGRAAGDGTEASP